MKIGFVANVNDRAILERVRFYRNDIEILQKIGSEVHIASRWQQVRWGMDVYFVWWWSYALPILGLSKTQHKPCVITGVTNYESPDADVKSKNYLVNRPRWQQGIMRAAIRYASMNILLSENEMKMIKRHIPNAKTMYVPLGVDTNTYRPRNDKRAPFLLNIAWSGEVNAERKCLTEIIEGFAMIAHDVPAARLIMGGTPGNGLPALVERARSLGVLKRVDFVGAISEEQKVALMQSCLAYVQPSRYEGFGLAIAEAMACGAPVISSPVGAIPEVVGDAGILVAGTDVGAIADAMRRVLDNQELRDDLGERGRRRIAERFSFSRRAAGLKAVLEAIS